MKRYVWSRDVGEMVVQKPERQIAGIFTSFLMYVCGLGVLVVSTITLKEILSNEFTPR